MRTILKEKCYKKIIWHDILYGTECRATMRNHTYKISVAKMHILRGMCGKSHNEKIKNEKILGYLEIEPIDK